MSTEFAKPTKYPLLETVLAYMGLPMKGKFTVKLVSAKFSLSHAAISAPQLLDCEALLASL